MDLLKLKIQYPESFPKTAESAFKFNIYITPKAKGLGIIGIAELVVSIFLSKEVKDRNGNPASLIQLAKAFEYVLTSVLGTYMINKQKSIIESLAT